MKLLLSIFIGGGLGSLARYGLSKLPGTATSGFPYGTLAANLLACVVLGLVWGLVDRKLNIDPNLKAMIMVGFCGGFSTFSTFSYETLKMIQEGRSVVAVVYVGISVMICLGALLAGDWMGKVFVGS